MSKRMPLYQYFMLWRIEIGQEYELDGESRLSDTLEDRDVYDWDNLRGKGYMYRRTENGRSYVRLTDKALNLIKRKAKESGEA